jgi:hypothetical protein
LQILLILDPVYRSRQPIKTIKKPSARPKVFYFFY